ncbi:P1 family peptidase [Paraburkholderia terrae]|nr:P1 family peptidase [Paraburkholderia terrae]
MNMLSMPHVGVLPAGVLGTIGDVAGVTVGHCTLADGPIQTGVTVVRAHRDDPYRHKVPAAASVINGFGKSIGLVQVEELGVLETPIALTNTFGVAAVAQAQIRAAVASSPQIGREWSTVNPLVFECNDGYLNDIQALAVADQHYVAALDAATSRFERGSVGAGRGMSCFDLKGGMGSASRIVNVARQDFTVGALVLANFGRLPMLTIDGVPIGRELSARKQTSTQPTATKPEQGSIIMIVATDAPLDSRQLKRLSMRAAAGLARTGSVYGHGSGDIASRSRRRGLFRMRPISSQRRRCSATRVSIRCFTHARIASSRQSSMHCGPPPPSPGATRTHVFRCVKRRPISNNC